MKPAIDKPILAFPKEPRWQNKKWLDEVKTRACFLTHKYTNEYETVDPDHIGTGGKGMKCHDYEVWPVIHRLHKLRHDKGWAVMLEPFLKKNPWQLFVVLLKAYWFIECLKFVSGKSRYELIKHFEEMK